MCACVCLFVCVTTTNRANGERDKFAWELKCLDAHVGSLALVLCKGLQEPLLLDLDLELQRRNTQ